MATEVTSTGGCRSRGQEGVSGRVMSSEHPRKRPHYPPPGPGTQECTSGDVRVPRPSFHGVPVQQGPGPGDPASGTARPWGSPCSSRVM